MDSDEYLNYEADMKFISTTLAKKYKGFEVLNMALNFQKC